MNYSNVLQGIENAKRFLRPYTQIDCVLTDTGSRVVSWRGRKPGVFKNTYYPMEYQYLIDHQQYSILLSDGSFFQFYYAFSDNKLAKARLAYYPRPIATSDSVAELENAAEGAIDRFDEDLYEHLYNWIELLDLQGKSPSNTSHIRFDYDANVTSHCKSHIQFGGVQELRVPSRCFPLPLVFIEMCIPIFSEGVLGDVEPLDLVFEQNNVYQTERPNELLILSI